MIKQDEAKRDTVALVSASDKHLLYIYIPRFTRTVCDHKSLHPQDKL